MTGPLMLSGDPTAALHAVPRQYAVAKAGDEMTGHLTLPTFPAAANAVRRDYVDALNTATNARFQRISLAGGKSFDVTVPAGATAARLTCIIVPTTATSIVPLLQLSVASGVFINTVGQYILYGYQHATGSTPTAVTAISASATLAGILVTAAQTHATLPIQFDGTIGLTRLSVSHQFAGDFRGVAFNANGVCHTFYYSYMTPASGLSVLALRLLSTTGDNWAAGSYLNVEWM